MLFRGLVLLVALTTAGGAAVSEHDTRPDTLPQHDTNKTEAFAIRSYFYVGGQYMNVTPPSSNTTATYMVGQIYVEALQPTFRKHDYPILFIAGNYQTGTNWLNNPDGREGWASYFLRQGYIVYLTDQAQRGRSPWLPGSGDQTAASVETIEKQFTAPEKFPSYPQAKLHTQWPGSGLAGDPVFDALYASQVGAQNNATLQARYNNISYTALLDEIGPAIVVAHSQAGPFGFKLADVRPNLVKGLVSIEPEGPPFENYAGPPFDPSYIKPAANRNRPFGLTLLPLEYDPPIDGNASLLVRQNLSAPNGELSPCILQAKPARKLVNLAKVPVLFITSEASYHAVYDHCTVAYLEQAGVKVDWLDLPKVGIEGNGHFVFLEKNNLEIASKISSWIRGLSGTD